MIKTVTDSFQQTEELGTKIASVLKGNEMIALFGDLGAGKTAFTRGLAAALGCTMQVSSPTYTIVNEYPGTRKVCHFDMYRLPDEDALWDIGWEDYLASGALCVVEWSENVPGAFPPGTVEVHIEHTGETSRRITVLC